MRNRRSGSNRKSVVRKRAVRRSNCIEHLETRRLLVAEGSAFELSRTFDTTGLAGALSSTIRWGDGTETSGDVAGSLDTNGPINITFRYEGSFFSGANSGRRALLESVADSIVSRFSDDLEAINPTGLLQWDAVTTNPATGAPLTVPNLQVDANEIIIYVGAHDLPGNRVGEAGPGSFGFAPFAGTTQEIAQVEEFRETVLYRGESGAEGTNPTDVGPWGGFIAFDSLTNWHFGASENGLDDDEVDFMSVAAHELLHVLGFGVVFAGGVNSSWETFTNSTSFTGPNARAVHGGNVPLEDGNHFGQDLISRGQQSLVAPEIPRGERVVLTPLDLAALDDIGWSVRSAPDAVVTGSYVYPDNPDEGSTFPVEVVLTGSRFGSITTSLTSTVTNVAPTLTVPGNQTIQIDQPISITDIGSISDPGFRNNNADTPTVETFEFTIDWGDGTQNDTGTATIDRQGSSGLATLASFNGTHTYDATGNFTVRITATDDDGATTAETFRITVSPPPVLSLAVSQGSVRESAGANAASLTITRSGPAIDSPLTVNLSSSDPSEATVPATAVIPAGATSVEVSIAAVDDNLLDGTQTVTFTAMASGADLGTRDLSVLDEETLITSINVASFREDQPTAARLVVTRSNTDTQEPLTVRIAGGDSTQVDVPTSVVIPAGQRAFSVGLVPVDDDDAELALSLTYTVTADGYTGQSSDVLLLDNEPPLFQNQTDQFDVDNNTDVTALDALRIINLINLRDGAGLDPRIDQFENFFPDVNGDYQVTALDALQTINELARRTESGEGEQLTADRDNALLQALSDFDDENNELLYFEFDEPTLS